MQRKYTVDEIGRMRAALIGRYPVREVQMAQIGEWSHPTEETYRRRAERQVRVEDEIRTYMLNGTDPDEICGAK